MTEKELIILKCGLSDHYGALVKVIERSKELKEGGFTRTYILQVLNGTRSNKELLQICQEVLIEYKKKDKELNNQLNANMAVITQLVQA